MKVIRNVLRIIGWLFIVLNVIALIGRLPSIKAELTNLAGAAEQFGYLFGSFILIYIALFFFYLARLIDRKIRKKEGQEAVANFLS